MAETDYKPRRFGKYRLVRKIGVGGMAEVYKAEYAKDSGPPIAIKRILTDLSGDKKLISMLVNEAKLAMMLNHPNIVPIYDFGLIDGHYFIAMEYIEGQDLRAFLKKAYLENSAIPLEVIIHIMTSVLEGLNYAHTRKDNFNKPLEITHRDISPQNIIISYTGEVKILDFGIAKAKDSLLDTQAGILKGKFSYMSPEQAKGKDIDPRSDIFSAGIVFHELLTVRSLFGGGSELNTLEKVRKARVKNPSAINASIPKSLSVIVMNALSKRRWRRFQTAGEFKDQIILWASERGLKSGKSVTQKYIFKEFPPKQDLGIPLLEPVTSEEIQNGSAISSGFEETLVSDPHIIAKTEHERSLNKTLVPEERISRFRETLGSIPNIFRMIPTNIIKMSISKLFSLRVLSLAAIAALAVILFLNRDRAALSPEFFEKAHGILIKTPRAALAEYRKAGSKDENGLNYDPAAAFETGPLLMFSDEALNFLSGIPLAQYDRIVEILKNQRASLTHGGNVTEKIDGLTVTYRLESPGKNLLVVAVK